MFRRPPKLNGNKFSLRKSAHYCSFPQLFLNIRGLEKSFFLINLSIPLVDVSPAEWCMNGMPRQTDPHSLSLFYAYWIQQLLLLLLYLWEKKWGRKAAETGTADWDTTLFSRLVRYLKNFFWSCLISRHNDVSQSSKFRHKNKFSVNSK